MIYKVLFYFIISFLHISCQKNTYDAEYGVMTISREQTQSWVRNFNPLSPGANARWPTTSGIFEPLFIYNSMKNNELESVLPRLEDHWCLVVQFVF